MALELLTTSGAKKDQTEALHLIAGADDCRLVVAGETFNREPIVAIVVQEDTVLTALIAGDSQSTDVVGSDDSGEERGYKNLAGNTIRAGMLLTPGRYDKGRTFESVTVDTGAIWVYYNYTVETE